MMCITTDGETECEGEEKGSCSGDNEFHVVFSRILIWGVWSGLGLLQRCCGFCIERQISHREILGRYHYHYHGVLFRVCPIVEYILLTPLLFALL